MKNARRMSAIAGASLAVGLLAAATSVAVDSGTAAEARARCSHGSGVPGSFDHSHEAGNVRWYWLDHWRDVYDRHVNRMVTDRGSVDIAYC